MKRRWLVMLVLLAALAAAAWLGFGAGAGSREAVAYSPRVANTPPLRGVMSPPRDMTGEDMEVLAGWNVTLVRFQIMRNWLQRDTDRDLQEYDSWFNSRLDNLEAMLPLAKRLGIRMVVDFHTPPGGRADGNSMRMFDEEEYAAHFVAVWKRIAERFKNNPDREAIWAYDLLNEPIESPEAAKRGAADALLLRAAQAIRAVDPDMPLAVPSLYGGGPDTFRILRPMPLENVIYEAHMYLPFVYTHQLALPETTPPGGEFVEYPGFIEGEMWTKSRLRTALQPVRDFQLRHGARIYIGEFSTIVWAPGGGAWLGDCISLFEEYGWDWSYHSFREWDGFSIEHEGAPPDRFWPAPDNPRMRVFLNALRATK
ncbi:MAG: glycoside hydrolase family 5 protein [Planctomycetota bacterium]|jgi:hypothetical protein|nr:glycoside hydrolase family 5 protein [Planctomycetota bacterium]